MSRAQHRDPQKEQFWQEAVTAWQKSGQSVRRVPDHGNLEHRVWHALSHGCEGRGDSLRRHVSSRN